MSDHYNEYEMEQDHLGLLKLHIDEDDVMSDGENEHIDISNLNVTEMLEDDDESSKRYPVESTEKVISEVDQKKKSPDVIDEEPSNKTVKKSVKERLGIRQVHTPAQQRLNNGASRQSSYVLNSNYYRPKKFKLKRIELNNSNVNRNECVAGAKRGAPKIPTATSTPRKTTEARATYSVPPPCITVPPPGVKPLSDFMVKSMACELCAIIAFKHKIFYNVNDIERALATARRS